MMFIHHFFTFPDRWIDGVDYPVLSALAPYLCQPFKLCVPVFSFVTGYIYYYNNNKTYRYSARKISDLLIDYWVAYALLAVVAITTTSYTYKLLDLFEEMFALQRPTMRFCWYVCYYYMLMFILPLSAKFMGKNAFADLFVIVIVPFLINNIYVRSSNEIIKELLTDLSWLPTALIGFVVAAHNAFEKVEKYLDTHIKKEWLKLLILICFIVASFIGRYLEPEVSIMFAWPNKTISVNLDVLYAPLFVFSIVYLRKLIKGRNKKYRILHFAENTVSSIGKMSLLMWFFHCIFFNMCSNVFQPILYFPRNPILVTTWGLLISYCAAVVLSFATQKIKDLKNRYLFKS